MYACKTQKFKATVLGLHCARMKRLLRWPFSAKRNGANGNGSKGETKRNGSSEKGGSLS